MKIILVGAHGTGKSTLANMLSKKKSWPVIESASRNIKELMKSGKIDISEKEYHLLITEFNKILWMDTETACKHITHIFTRTLIDNLAYSELEYDEMWDSEYYNTLKDFDMRDCIFFLLPIEFELEKDGVRYEDSDYQQYIAQRQLEIMAHLIYDGAIDRDNIYDVTGTPVERLEQIENVLKNY